MEEQVMAHEIDSNKTPSDQQATSGRNPVADGRVTPRVGDHRLTSLRRILAEGRRGVRQFRKRPIILDDGGAAALEFAILAAALIPAGVGAGYAIGPPLLDFAQQLTSAVADACDALRAAGKSCPQ
jgi:Flp pilus assembly pilin Flp